MSLKQIQEAKLSHAMTHDLQESIKILQYSHLELLSYINNQIEENPFLFINEPLDENTNDSSDNESETIEDDLNFEDYVSSALYEENDSYFKAEKKGGTIDDNYFQELKTISLRDHVYEQLNIDIICNRSKIIATYLVEMLDDNGYIELNYDYITDRIKCKKEEIDNVLGKLQNFDPPGVFARSLSECLALQLIEKKLMNEDFKCLLENLPLLAKTEFNQIKKACNISEEKFKKYLTVIRSLNPKPGNVFDDGIVQIIEPDIFLKKSADEWVLELNNNFLPKVIVNKTYYKEAKINTKQKDSKKYLSKFYSNANWLINSLNHRSETLMKVTHKIVEKQIDFFDKGINFLHSMSLSEIANEANLSISTISRITTNKYLSTPIGVFELKYFFSSSMPNSEGNNNSNKQLKHMIKLIIENEKSGNVYSDLDIVNLLKNKGFVIARRTVTKYREKMNIPPSSVRKNKMRLEETS